MKNLKKVLSIILVLAMAGFVLSGCGQQTNPGGETTANGSTAAAENVTEPVAQKLDFVKVKLNVAGSEQKDHDKVAEEYNKIFREKINAELDIEVMAWDTFRDKLVAMYSSNEPLDLIFTGSGLGYLDDVNRQAFMAIEDEMIDQYAPDMKANINPLYLVGPRIKGKLYMIPTNKEIAEGHSLMIRRDIADKYGLDISRIRGGIDELIPFLEKVKEGEKGMSPLSGDIAWYGVTTKYIDNMPKYSEAAGSFYVNVEDGKVYSSFDLDWVVDRYKIYRELNQKGLFSLDVQEGVISQDDAVKTGKIAAWSGMNKPGEAKSTQIYFGLEQEPYMLTGAKPLISTSSTAGAGLAIRATSKNAERAMMIVNLLWSDSEIIHLVQEGIENVHYVKVNDTQKKLPEGISSTGDTGYDPGFSWMFGNLFQTYVWDSEAPDKHKQFMDFNKSGFTSPTLGFIFDQEPVKTELASLSSISSKYIGMLDKGQLDVDEALKKLRDELKAGGIDRVIAEIQRQYDDWKANK